MAHGARKIGKCVGKLQINLLSSLGVQTNLFSNFTKLLNSQRNLLEIRSEIRVQTNLPAQCRQICFRLREKSTKGAYANSVDLYAIFLMVVGCGGTKILLSILLSAVAVLSSLLSKVGK